MFVIFLLVHLFFAGAFFLLRAYAEAGWFVLLGILSVFLFGPFRFWWDKSEEREEAASKLDTVRFRIKERAVSFFRNGVMPLSVTFFYLALFGIVWSLEDALGMGLGTFSHVLAMFVSIAWAAAFYSPIREKRFVLDLVRANLLVSSVIEMGMLSVHLAQSDSISVLAFFSGLFLLGGLAVTFYEEYRRGDLISHPFLLLFFFFSYLFLTATVLSILGFASPLWVYATVALLLGAGFFETVSYRMFRDCRVFVRLFSVLSVYIGTLGLLILYLVAGVGHGALVLLAFAFFFNFYVHKKFENYVSLLFCLFVVIAVFERIIGIFDGFIMTLISASLLSFGLAFASRPLKSPHPYDQYFFQIAAIVSAVGHFLWYMARYGMLGMLEFSILLLFFSALLFVSYVRIANK